MPSQNDYNALTATPLATLQQMALTVNALPPQADGTAAMLWFASGPNGIVIDRGKVRTVGMAGAAANDVIQRRMIVSPMRDYGMTAAQRQGRARIVQAVGPGTRLWVTEMQTGCSVLILDWGGHAYSMVHLQPSTDAQFNKFGRAVIGLGNFFLGSYKNEWLKQELTSVVINTNRTPLRYIMVQSMFEASRGNVTQLIGVRQGLGFVFFRQLQGNALQAEQLTWSGWYPGIPYFTY